MTTNKAEVLNNSFTKFSLAITLLPSEVPEPPDRGLGNEVSPIVREDRVQDHLRNLGIHKSLRPKEMNPGVLRELATNLSGAVDSLEGRDAIQRDLDRLEEGAHVNLMSVSMAKCKVLHVDWRNPQYQYRLGDDRIESSPEEKDLGVLVEEKLNMTRQCVLTAPKANGTLDCMPSSVGTGRRRGFCPSAPLW